MVNITARWSGLGIILLVASTLAGCIQPDYVAETPTPTVDPFNAGLVSLTLTPGAAAAGANGFAAPAIPTSATGNTGAGSLPPRLDTVPEAAPSAARPLVVPFIQSRGDDPLTLQVWYDAPLGSDQLQGFSYTKAQTGELCAGFLLANAFSGQWQATNGALGCGPPGSQAIASVALFATSDGQPYTVVFGRADDVNITAVAIQYNDGSNAFTQAPFSGRFLMIKPGVYNVNIITATDALGNTVLFNIPQTPARY